MSPSRDLWRRRTAVRRHRDVVEYERFSRRTLDGGCRKRLDGAAAKGPAETLVIGEGPAPL